MVQSWIWTLVSVVVSATWIAGVDVDTDQSGGGLISLANQRDSVALMAIYNATNGPSWTNGWDFDQPIDTWHGVSTDMNGDVVELDLSNNNLSGRLPDEMGFLSELKILKLGFNDIHGNLPVSVGSMINLEEIFLFQNSLDVPIPDTIVNLPNLRILSLASNNIPGQIPRRIGRLTSLEMLVLDGNDLEGTIPASIGQMSNLVFLDLHNNDLEGAIPASVSNLSHLRELLLYDNQLSESIPSTVVFMDSLQFFWVHNNQLEGTLPLMTNPVLRSIRVDRNRLDELPDLSSLQLGSTFPDGLSAELNQLSFDDIIENQIFGQGSRFSYAPQDSLLDPGMTFYANKGDRLEIQLPFDDTITSSRYRWFKAGNLSQLTDVNRMVISIVDDSDAGRYHAEIINTVIPDLELVTHQFDIIVRDSADCDIPPSGRSCVDAPLFCHTSDLDLYCGTLQPALDTVLCQDIALTAEASWIGFTTDSAAPTIQILPYSCSSQSAGIQVAVYRNCRRKELVYCSTGCNDGDFEIKLNNTEPNEAYYLAIRSCGGACKYQIRAFSTGDPIPLNLAGPILGPDTICGTGDTYRYIINDAPSAAQSFEWYLNEDTIETVVPELDISWNDLGSRQLCVRAISECGESGVICQDIEIFPGLDLDNKQTEVVRNDSFYVLSFTVSGGVGPIVVDGLSGVYNALDKTFISDLIRCGTRYTVTVTDKNECREVLMGIEVCNCSSEAGELFTTLVESCGQMPADVGPLFGSQKDSNDVGAYVILESSVFNRNQILAISSTPEFSAPASGLEFDQQYYAFHIVGSNDGTGLPDLGDPCLSASNARPVIFYSAPDANAGPDTFHCERTFPVRATRSKPTSNGRWTQLSGPSVAFIDNDRAVLTSITTGAEGMYVFTWTETFQNCSDTDTLNILVRPTVSGAILGPDSLCSGETATLELDRSFESYLWDGGQRTAAIRIPGPGEYCVRVFTDDGCTRRFCKTVTETRIEAPQIMGRNVICEGDMETLQVIPNYQSYRWSTGENRFFIDIDSPGLYCITVTDFNGCKADDCILVNEAKDRVANFVDTICYGDTIEIFDEVFSESGSYSLRRDVGGVCDSVVNLLLHVREEIFISDSLVIGDDGSGSGAISVNIKGGAPPYEYLWSTGAMIPFVNNLTAGIYTLEVTDNEGCQAIFEFDLRKPNSVDEPFGFSKVRLLPNPVHSGDKLYINIEQEVFRMTYDILTPSGQLVKKGIIYFDNTSKSGFIPISTDLEGLYLLQLRDENGQYRWLRFLVIP